MESAAIELMSTIIKQLDNGDIPTSIFIDLSKAFDNLDHGILFHKLEYYGVKGSDSLLIKNYFSGHQQNVNYDGTKSSSLAVTTRVTQGSILGPLLFMIYINDLRQATNHLNYLKYTDDTTHSTTINSYEPISVQEKKHK